MYKFIAVAYILFANIEALPNSPTTVSSACPAKKTAYATTEDINFDTLSPVPSGVSASTNTITGGLLFQSFGVFNGQAAAALTGVTPHSPPNFIQTGFVTQTTSGDAMITVNFPNSNTTSFDISSLYLGCVVGAASGGVDTPATPQSCTVGFAGYKGSDNSVSNAVQVCALSAEYLPSTNVGIQQQTRVSFPSSCHGLSFLTIHFNIEPASSQAVQNRLELNLDDVVVTIRGCKT